MKLFARYNRVNLVTNIVLMLITGFAYYQAISWVLTRQKDKDLQNEEMEILEYVKYNQELPQVFESKYLQIAFKIVPTSSVKRKFIDTLYYKKWGKDNPKRRIYHTDGDYEPGRGLVTAVIAGHQYYKVIIVESKVETEDLIRIIFLITAGVILLLLLLLLMTSRLILNRLWRPFYSIMHELKLFNIAEPTAIPKLDTVIDEFKEMNAVVSEMAAKAKHDYQTLKTFTENASHEFNTPIAIINSKLDSLLQTDAFNEKQGKLLDDLYEGVSRINRLNQSLLLLVKIENRLLQEMQRIDLKTLIEEMLIQFEEIYQDKELILRYQLHEKEIFANSYLIEILLSNLITNAIRHNYTGGEMILELSNESFSIRNTGESRALSGDEIFTRFHKSSGSEGSGLGLTICRQICENFDLSLTYNFDSPYHIFTVLFPA
ncbi:sensor histidine kinase [Mucilaginibacter corticis]|uniref:histidine kinase n=1 Tax=Mucilaginibacter corticis TaxID=2597670 RepID=A0A556MM87_9SPHI|nr:sensor histidine kinase [Mucilaginibacter corticis]TSJ41023.1 sensor histidine kinase [Mucilaginibacter corticis]